MEVKNPLYKNIGIHVMCSLFTVDNGRVKVLLIKRKKEPFKDMWALVGGALYNNETIEVGLRREIYEKTGLKNIDLYFSNIDDEVERSPLKRMIAVNFIGVIAKDNIISKNTEKTCDSEWFSLEEIGKLAYNHEKTLKVARDNFKKLVVSSTVLKSLFPKGFTMPELQMTYEGVLDKKFDRRNFRKKILSIGLIRETNSMVVFKGKKPAKKYVFKDVIIEKEIL